MIHPPQTPNFKPDELPYQLRKILADLCGLRTALIPHNFAFAAGAVAYAASIPETSHGIRPHRATLLRAWVANFERTAEGRTYDSLTEAEKSQLARTKSFWLA